MNKFFATVAIVAGLLSAGSSAHARNIMNVLSPGNSKFFETKGYINAGTNPAWRNCMNKQMGYLPADSWTRKNRLAMDGYCRDHAGSPAR